MSGSLRELFSFDVHSLATHFAMLALAFIVTLPVGWDQERSTRAAGIRTFPLVAVGAAAYVILGRVTLGDDAGAHSRLLQGLVTGIGFIGGGAILKTRDRVRGTATAASLWSTAAIGAAVAYEQIDVASLLSAINFLALRLLRPLRRRISGEDDRLGAVEDARGGSSERDGRSSPRGA